MLKSKINKLVTGFAGLALTLGFAVTPVIASAQSATDLQAQINSLLATIQSLQSQLAGTSGSTVSSSYTFNANLTVGSTGTDVMNLQKFLNSSADTKVAATGAGSPGNESSYFGPATKAAVMKFQAKYGISPVSGYFGPLTRAKANSMSTGTTGGTSTGGTTTPTVGGSLVFGAPTQPANSLAPENAARVPFTTFTLTNTGSAAVTVNGVTVQRTGLGQDSVFSGIVLVDSNNVQIGTSKTLNSNHQAVIGDTFTINAGETKTLTVAGNLNSVLDSYAGQVVSISVVGVNSSATVSGSFPVTGAQHTVNASLTIGSVSTSTSSFDPGASQQRNIGDTGVRFSGIKFTANSAEDLKLYSLRWRQVGTASASDISNVVTIVNGTSYPATLSADGKYYTSVFPGGLLIGKGNSAEAYIQGDISGSNASSRTVRFDIDKVTDVYFVGQLYGYGVAPSGTYTPWFTANTTTINAGTVTTIAKANEVTAQNIASNVSNQVLGGFATNFAGESVSVQQMTFTLSTTSASLGGLVTSVSIVDQNGAVVAGPVDATWVSGNSQQTLTFTDTVTFPVGRHVYTLKGKIPSSASNGSIITLATNPSSWSNVTGQTSGNSVAIGTTSFNMNSVTVKAAQVAINLSSQPTSQSIVSGAQNLVLANFQLDASQSGEDVRLSSLPVIITAAAGGVAGDLTGCQLWNGTTALNTGSRVVNTFTSGTAKTYSFDNSFIVSKGTIATLSLSCNVSSSAAANSTYQVTADTTNGDYAITGQTSGNSVTTSAGLTLGTANGGTMTVNSGSLAASVDSSSPSYTVVAGGSTGATVGVVKFRATNEALNLTKVGLTLTAGSSTDVTNVYLYNGATLLGTATFTGNNTTATSTFSNAFALAKDTDVLITIKADFTDIGTSQSGTEGKLVKIDALNAEGTGVASGATIQKGAITAGVSGVRVFNSYPTLALDTLSSTGIGDGKLMRFKVTANAAGAVGISQLKFNLATTTLSFTNIGLYAYTDSGYSNGISSQGTSGQIGSTMAVGSATGGVFTLTGAPTTNPIQVPAGTTLYFELRGTPSANATGASAVTTLLGDSAYPVTANPIDQTRGYFVATSSALTAGHNFIWSGNATSTSSTSDVDWSNGYGLPGLPSSGLIQGRSY